METATLANGSFWITESFFQNLDGINRVTGGYSGGFIDSPTYEEVCDRNTGHAECLLIEYDPSIISFDELLEIFWSSHDPTTLNRQGKYIGPQYRSAIFYHNEEQRERAEMYKNKLNHSDIFPTPVVTAIEAIPELLPG